LVLSNISFRRKLLEKKARQTVYSKNNFAILFMLFITTLVFCDYALVRESSLLIVEKIDVSVLSEHGDNDFW
jgi:hypothetical protein